MHCIKKIHLQPALATALSVAFTVLLLLIRLVYTTSYAYRFYVWNLLLALAPLFFSRRLSHRNPACINSLLLFAWLIFLPNAPYLVTDVIHFGNRPPMPLWFDLLLVTSAACSGLLITMLSLLDAEKFLYAYCKTYTPFVTGGVVMLCSCGVYIGRFLRFNSWDVLVQPRLLAAALVQPLLSPLAYWLVWTGCLFFSAVLLGTYYVWKKYFAGASPAMAGMNSGTNTW